MIVCLKCNDCGNEFFVEDTVIKEYEARQKMANSLNTQAMFAGASQLLDQLSGKSDFSSMETYIKLRDINVLNAESKMLKNGNPFICPNCGSENTRFMTQKEINVYMENLQSEIEDKEKQEKAKNRKINPNATLEQLKERILLFIEDGEWYEAEHYVEHTLDIATTDYYLYYLQFLIMNRCKNNSGLLKKGIGFDKRNKIVSKIFKYADKDFLANLTRHNLNLQINNLQGSPIKLLESYKDISKNFDINDPLNKLNYKKFIQSIKNFDLKTQDIRFIIDAFKNEIFTKEQSAEIINAINDILEKNFSENEHSVFQILNCLNSNNINLNENLEIVNYINTNIESKCVKVINQIINQKNYIDYTSEIPILKQIKNNSLNALYEKIIEKIKTFINNDILDFEKIDEKNIDYVNINKDLERFEKVKNLISNLQLSFPDFDVLIDKFKPIAKNIQQKEKNYSYALEAYNNKKYKEAFDTFNKILNYKNSEKLANECKICLEEKKKKKNKLILCITSIITITIISFILIYLRHINTTHDYVYAYKKGDVVHITNNLFKIGAKKTHFLDDYDCEYIVIDNKIKLEDNGSLFRECYELKRIDGLSNIDVSNETDLSNMFRDCRDLESIEGVENWDVSNVIYMSHIFSNCYRLKSIEPLKNWNVSNLKSLGGENEFGTINYDSGAFSSCRSLTTLKGLENWNVSNITDIYHTFIGCRSLNLLESLQNWDVSNVTNMQEAFAYCEKLMSLKGLENWNVSNVVNLESTFRGCKNLRKLNGLEKWNVLNVKDIDYTFADCDLLSDISALKNWHSRYDVSTYSLFRESYGKSSQIDYGDEITIKKSISGTLKVE